MGKSAPRAPDPMQTAQAQAGLNRQTAITQQELNMVNQTNPYGSVRYNQTGTTASGNPIWNQTTTFSPGQQAIFDQTQAAQTNLAELANQQSGMLQERLANPFEFNNRDAENWAYDLGSARLDPRFEQQRSSMATQLANQGVAPGSRAWEAAMASQGQNENDAYNQLMLQGRGQAFNEALTTYNAPVNTITALMSGSQVSNPAQMSGATPQASVGGVDYTGLVNQQFQADTANYQAKMGGLGGLFGAGLQAAGMFSDARLKTDVTRVGTTDGGTPIYTYRYITGGPVQMGVMAQDVPEAATMHESGFLMVDYGKVQ